MVGEDEFHFSGPGPDEIFNQINLVVVYRFSLEIENARAMIGRNNSRTNNFTQMLGHEGGEGDKTTQRNENVLRPNFPNHQSSQCFFWLILFIPSFLYIIKHLKPVIITINLKKNSTTYYSN